MMMMKQIKQQKRALVPRAVFPTHPRLHGLFGIALAKRHMFDDDRWSAGSLADQFKSMADMLVKRKTFKLLKKEANRKQLINQYQYLKQECRDGRHKLQMSLHGDTYTKIRNYLINHKDMQRLYQRMPAHIVVDNINQRTFLMRKERDRLRYQLCQLRKIYEGKLLQGGDLENRIKYQNEFMLEEEGRSMKYRTKIQKSYVRLKAIKTINTTYTKMVQVLRNEQIFYEPIFHSLMKDLKDQSTFIGNVLFIGKSAMTKYGALCEEYRLLEDKARKNVLSKSTLIASNMKWRNTAKGDNPVSGLVIKARYVRETNYMYYLKHELEIVEDTIKKVKFTTLCLQAREIYPRLKMQFNNNEKLHKLIENSNVGHQNLNLKKKKAGLMEVLLINNLTDEEMKRLSTIQKLNEEIEQEDQLEAKNMAHMKNRADLFVLMKFTLWNLDEILRHNVRASRVKHLSYPNSYLRLPLLKFDTQPMRAVPPEPFDDNVDQILHGVKRKVQRLMKVYNEGDVGSNIGEYREQYRNVLRDGRTSQILVDGERPKKRQAEIQESVDLKIVQKIPDNAAIKDQSRKLMDDHSKKDE